MTVDFPRHEESEPGRPAVRAAAANLVSRFRLRAGEEPVAPTVLRLGLVRERSKAQRQTVAWNSFVTEVAQVAGDRRAAMHCIVREVGARDRAEHERSVVVPLIEQLIEVARGMGQDCPATNGHVPHGAGALVDDVAFVREESSRLHPSLTGLEAIAPSAGAWYAEGAAVIRRRASVVYEDVFDTVLAIARGNDVQEKLHPRHADLKRSRKPGPERFDRTAFQSNYRHLDNLRLRLETLPTALDPSIDAAVARTLLQEALANPHVQAARRLSEALETSSKVWQHVINELPPTHHFAYLKTASDLEVELRTVVDLGRAASRPSAVFRPGEVAGHGL